MKLRIPKLTSLKGLHAGGFGHIELVVAVLVVGLFGLVGYRVVASHADPLLTSTTCQLRGRVWAGNACQKTCLSGAGSHVVANPYDYCSGALSKISSTVCAANGRKWLNVGCARRWQQTNAANAIQCVTAGATYVVANPYDRCSGAVATNFVTLVNNSYVKVEACSVSASTFRTRTTNNTASPTNFSIAELGSNSLDGLTGDVLAAHATYTMPSNVTFGFHPPQNLVIYKDFTVVATISGNSAAFTKVFTTRCN